MTILLIKFSFQLGRYGLDEFGHPHGLLFHKWLPNGENDAISIKTKSKNVKVFVWFERCGFVQNGWIRFDYKKREVDQNILKRQAMLDAGPLRGKIEIKGIKQEEFQSLVDKEKGGENYVKIGKRLIKILNESVIPFIKTLRLYYGQYWLRELHRWNSKNESLGNYFHHIYAKYSTDNGKNWEDFIPDEMEVRATVTTLIVDSDYSSYFSKNDWNSLNDFPVEDFEHSLAINLLLNARQLKDQDDYKQAFIEGITSLEIALSILFQDRLSLSNKLKRKMESFWTLPLRTQLTVIASLTEGLSHEDISKAINSIEIRNKIVHEGWSPKTDTETKKTLNCLFKVISKLITDKTMKFPISYRSYIIPIDEKETE